HLVEDGEGAEAEGCVRRGPRERRAGDEQRYQARKNYSLFHCRSLPRGPTCLPSLWPIGRTLMGKYLGGGRAASGDVEHRRVEAERALADGLEHAIDRRRHQRAGSEIAERTLGGKVLVRAAAADHLDHLRGDVQADLGGQVLRPVRERPEGGEVRVVPAR